MSKYSHPGGGVAIDAESLAGMRFPYQEDRSLVEDIDLLAATPGEDINWLEDIQLLVEDGVPAVFDRYTNAFIKIYFEIPPGREDELARKVLIKHLQSGNSYGIQLKREHCRRSSRAAMHGSVPGPHAWGQTRTLRVRPARCGPDPERARPLASSRL